jgi:hypothetical protein
MIITELQLVLKTRKSLLSGDTNIRHTITLTVTTIQGRHVPPTDLLACIVVVKGRQAPTGRSTLLGVLRRWVSHSRGKTSGILLKTT